MGETRKPVNEIVIDDGSVEVPIKNRHGVEIGKFYFHPTDVGIIGRYNQMVGAFNEITAPLEHVSIRPDGTADGDNAEEAAALEEAEKRLYAACDFMFGGNMSEAFFGKMHPFSPVNGSFYCERAIELVGKYIEAQFEQETKKIAKRVNRYTRDYLPKKNGRNKRP